MQPVFVVDAGDAFWKSRVIAEDSVPQAKRKAELIAASFAASGIDALTPGEGDLALGVPFVRELAEKYKLPYLAANLRCDGEPLFLPGRLVERGGLKVAFVGVVEAGSAPTGCQSGDPVAAAKQAFAELGAADARVLLSHQGSSADAVLAQAVPEIGLVVNGHDRLTHNAPRALTDATLQLAAGSRGKHLGVAVASLVAGATGFEVEDAREEIARRLDSTRERLRAAQARRESLKDAASVTRLDRQIQYYEGEIEKLDAGLKAATTGQRPPMSRVSNSLAALGTDVAGDPEVARLLAEAQADITRLEHAEGAPSTSDSTKFEYIGSAACAACHASEAAQWKTTAHARAWASLVAAGRSADQDCVGCHSTGYEQPGGPSRPAQIGGLTDVGCESCHGPARGHAAAPGPRQLLPSPPVHVCTRCHDGERDEGRFDAETYLPQVSHGGAVKAP